jgi:hypothetical protein
MRESFKAAGKPDAALTERDANPALVDADSAIPLAQPEVLGAGLEACIHREVRRCVGVIVGPGAGIPAKVLAVGENLLTGGDTALAGLR